jgi:ferredoxin
VKVIVDRDACEANGVCAGLVPEVFEVDDDDVLHIKLDVIPGSLADSVRHAVRSCPKTALSLEE